MYIEKLLSIKRINDNILESVIDIRSKLYKLTEEFKGDAAKLIRDMLQWILKIKNISLSEISRNSWKLVKWTKKKSIVASFSKFLKNTKLIERYMKKYVHKTTKVLWRWWKMVYIAVDGWDIKKEHSKSKDLCKVHDGSTWNIVNGYVLETAVWFNEDLETIPLYWKIYTRKDSAYKSDNKETFDLLETMKKYISKNVKICYIFDKWYDDKKLFEKVGLLWNNFIVALYRKRYLKIKWKTVLLENATTKLRKIKWEVEVIMKSGKRRRWYLYYWMVRIFEWNTKRKYRLVALKNNKWTSYYLTNVVVNNQEKAKKIIRTYSYRWLVEEIYKYIKQEYKLEYINLRSWVERMQNFYNLLLSWIWLWMIWLKIVWKEVKEMIIRFRKEHYLWYKLKNILYAWLEIVQYIMKLWKIIQNRYRKKRLSIQRITLFSQI